MKLTPDEEIVIQQMRDRDARVKESQRRADIHAKNIKWRYENDPWCEVCQCTAATARGYGRYYGVALTAEKQVQMGGLADGECNHDDMFPIAYRLCKKCALTVENYIREYLRP